MSGLPSGGPWLAPSAWTITGQAMPPTGFNATTLSLSAASKRNTAVKGSDAPW